MTSFATFLVRCAEDCVNGASGSVYARPLPSLEEPPPGARCGNERCGAALRLVGYCGACGWREESSGA